MGICNENIIVGNFASDCIRSNLKGSKNQKFPYMAHMLTHVCLSMLLQPYYHFFPIQQEILYETLIVVGELF